MSNCKCSELLIYLTSTALLLTYSLSLNFIIPIAFLQNYLFAGVDLAGASLQRLDLSDNAIGPVGMVGLGPFFKTKSSFSLKELILNNNGFGPEGGSVRSLTSQLNCYSNYSFSAPEILMNFTFRA